MIANINNNHISLCNQDHINNIEYFCKNCNFFICKDCYVITHNNHKIELLNYFVKNLTNSLENCLQITEDFFQGIPNIDELQIMIVKKYEESFDKFIEKLKKEKDILINNLLININFQNFIIEKKNIENELKNINKQIEFFKIDHNMADKNNLILQIKNTNIHRYEQDLYKFKLECEELMENSNYALKREINYNIEKKFLEKYFLDINNNEKEYLFLNNKKKKNSKGFFDNLFGGENSGTIFEENFLGANFIFGGNLFDNAQFFGSLFETKKG